MHNKSMHITVYCQEGGAAMMAEAMGKLTGRPRICMVARGSVAANAQAGIHDHQWLTLLSYDSVKKAES